MKVNPWKFIKSQGEIRFFQEIQFINLFHSWNVIYSWWNKKYILYYSWMNFISLWDFKKFSWMDFHLMKNGLESTSTSSPCEPHHSSTSTLSLPLLRKHIQQVWHLWNTTAMLVLDRWYWTMLVWWFLWWFCEWVWSVHIIHNWALFYTVVERCQVRWCKMCIHSISRV